MGGRGEEVIENRDPAVFASHYHKLLSCEFMLVEIIDESMKL